MFERSEGNSRGGFPAESKKFEEDLTSIQNHDLDSTISKHPLIAACHYGALRTRSRARPYRSLSRHHHPLPTQSPLQRDRAPRTPIPCPLLSQTSRLPTIFIAHHSFNTGNCSSIRVSLCPPQTRTSLLPWPDQQPRGCPISTKCPRRPQRRSHVPTRSRRGIGRIGGYGECTNDEANEG